MSMFEFCSCYNLTTLIEMLLILTSEVSDEKKIHDSSHPSTYSVQRDRPPKEKVQDSFWERFCD
eukprot:scaffold32284_cov140-Skeletonema_dohrnii-CCMP3373.AAC.2